MERRIAFQEEDLHTTFFHMQEGILVCDKEGNVKYANSSAQKPFPDIKTVIPGHLSRIIGENLSDLITILDADGTVLYASPSHQTILGINPDEYAGQSVFSRLHEDDAPILQGQLTPILNDHHGVATEFRWRHIKGHYVNFDAIVEPILNENAVVERLVVVAHDITTKKRQEQILQGQNKLLGLVVQDASLEEIFTEITQQVESIHHDVACGITTLIDNRVIHIAPSLPKEMTSTINSLDPNEIVQRYLNEEVFIEDVSEDGDCLRLGKYLQSTQYTSLWSRPIQSVEGTTVGIFAVLFKQSDEFNRIGLELYNTYAHIATMMIERRQSRSTIAATINRYKSLYDNNIDAVFQFDLQGFFVDVNESFLKMFGYTLPELRYMSFRSLVVDEHVLDATSVFERTKTGHTTRHEVDVWHRMGERMTVQVVSVPIKINGTVTGTFGIVKDITAHKYTQDLLANQKRVLEMIARGSDLEEVLHELTKIVEYHAPSSMCNVFLLNDDNRTLQHFTGHERVKQYSDSLGDVRIGPAVGACGTAPFLNEIVIVEDIETNRLYENYRHISLRNGLRACFAAPIVSSSGQVLGTFGLYYDKVKRPSEEDIELLKMISHLAGLAVEHKRSDDEIKNLAHYDLLTGLPNRATLFNQLSTAITNAEQGSYQLAVMYLDLDRFKSVNDSMGHHFGDRFLQSVSVRIKDSLDPGFVLSRLAGDEFTILLPRIDSVDVAKFVANCVINSFKDAVELDGHDFRVTTSVGVALFPDDGNDAETLMRNADLAMYEAKNNGKNTVCFYNNGMSEKLYERLMMESALQRALDNGEFMLHYQPRVDTKSKSVTSIEALLRWNKPGVGIVSPREFISIVEETGLIVPIGNWVLQAVCQQIKTWESLGKVPVRVAINVSPRQLQEPNFMEMVREVIQKTDVDPRWLEIEVTESGLIKNGAAALAILYEFKAIGMKISIDDFGVGYSSLNRLQRMPVDALKIDSSFIQDMVQNNAAITKTIITLAHNLHLNVVAEGVETEEQFNLLQQYGCDEIQGYYFTPPIAIDEFEHRYMT